MGKNVIIFGADMTSYGHIDKKKDILILVQEARQILEDTKLKAKPKYPVNFTQSIKICIHYKSTLH